MEEDAVRQLIADRLKEMGQTLIWLSLAMGKNHSYMQQYIKYGKPQDLDYKDKLKVHKLLGLTLEQLGIVLPPDIMPSPSAQALGVTDDAELYSSNIGVLAPHPPLVMYRVLSRAIERQRLGVLPGDIIFVDPRGADGPPEEGEAYLVKLYDKSNALTATTVIRQFVSPALLITNSAVGNSVGISLDDPELPFEPVIEGKIVRFLRGHS